MAWGPTKTKLARTVTLGEETITRLRTHCTLQREAMMVHRTMYIDHGLVRDGHRRALRALVGSLFRQVITAAGVRRITPHGAHTVATLLLELDTPVQIVARRLGHADVCETLNTHAHALPGAQRLAAAKLGKLLA